MAGTHRCANAAATVRPLPSLHPPGRPPASRLSPLIASRLSPPINAAGVVDVSAGTGSVELRRYPVSHPFSQLGGSDNIISFTTGRYRDAQPLIIRGPGAGAEVTAGGVFSDMLRLAAYLGAPS